MIAWLLVGFMWLYVHRPFEIWTFLATYRLLLVYTICLIIVWLFSVLSNPNSKRQLGNIFTPAILLYTLAITAATLFSPFTSVFENGALTDWFKHIVFFVILMTSVKTEKDLKIVVTGFSVAFFLWMAHSYRGYLSGNAFFEAGAYRIKPYGITFANANDYGTLIVCVLPLILPLIALCKRYWHYLFILGYVLLSLRSMMLTGSRGALVMLVVLMVLPVLFSRHRFKLLVVMAIAAPVGWQSISEEMQNRYRTIWDRSVSREANANLEGRMEGFYGGLQNWENYPIFGAGPGQHGQALGNTFRAHNLAGELLGELGTFGVVAFLLMLSCFGINHYNIWKNYKYLREKNLGKEGLYCWWVSLAIVYAIVMLQIQGFGLHIAYWFHWIWFGAFQALAVMIMQEKVDAAIQGKLLPSLPDTQSGYKVQTR